MSEGSADAHAERKHQIELDLVEMKDISELMVDLAYSALLFNNRDLAEEVQELEEQMDELYQKVMEQGILSSAEGGNPYATLAISQLATSLESMADSAMEIADVVLRDIEPHEVFRMSVEESDVEITTARISDGSELANKSLGEVTLSSETGIWVFAIKRGTQWVYGPEREDVLMPGDLVLARGPGKSVDEFMEIAAGDRPI